MTVARVRFTKDADFTEVLFLESSRIYHLLRTNPEYQSILRKLEQASSDVKPIRVCFDSIESDVIEEVR
jgi:hypothetical protein